MKEKIKTLGILFFVFIFFISCKTDEEYIMPFKPGVTVDKSVFDLHKKQWMDNRCQNYSYTYSYEIYEGDSILISYYILDVSVQEGSVTEYVLKEYDGENEDDMSEENWDERKQFVSAYCIKNKDNFLLENVYSLIEKQINDALSSYSENPDCYYGKIDFEFLDTLPYIHSYDSYENLMIKDLDGNAGRIVIKIENFRED